MSKTEKSNHTWTAYKSDTGASWGIHGGENRIASAISKPEHAHLIAAAPDLLEALINLLPHVSTAFTSPGIAEAVEQDMVNARKAIARAEGKQP